MMPAWENGIIGAMMTNYARKDYDMNEIVKKEDQLPIDLSQLEADAQLGGKIGIEDIAIPYLYILQNNSPQCNIDHAKYIKNAKAGMIYLTNLEKIYEGRESGVKFVPCFYERLITEWIPRSQGGGIIASHLPDADIIKQGKMTKVEDKDVLMLPNGHILIDTMYNYFLVQLPDTGVWVQCIAPFKSTGLKHARRMNNIIQTNKIPGTDKDAPRWLYYWQMYTAKEAQDNYVWSGYKLEQLPEMVNRSVYNKAKDYAIIAAKGVLRRLAIEADQEADTQTTAKPIIDDSSPI